MELLVACALGVVVVDVDADEVIDTESSTHVVSIDNIDVQLPRLVAAAQHGSTVVAVVDRRPPLVISNDAGLTWREAGGGLPSGMAVAISPDDPDVIAFAGHERLFLSRDGGRFWTALTPELAGITAIEIR